MEDVGKVTNRWRAWLGVSSIAALLITLLGIAWWQDHQTQSSEVDALRAEIEHLSSQAPIDSLRAENDDLIRFIDEAYGLLKEEGFHIQLELDQDKDGRYRLRAGSAELMDELEAKLRELDGQPATPPKDD